jgi:two-component system sensor histidine kinase KdpD
MGLPSTATQPPRGAIAPRPGAAPGRRPPLGDPAPAASAPPGQEPPLAVSVFAHELRAPLSSLAAASELLLDDLDRLEPRQMRDMLQTIRDGTLWLQGLVDNLLCAAALQAGRFQLRPERLSLLDVVMDVQPVVLPLLVQKGQSLKLAAAGQLPDVAADRRWIGQALVNLIANASKYSPADTPISVRLSQADNGVRATVADRGPGLPPGAEEQVFDTFYRGAEAAAADAGGVGLGLAIVKAVVAAHGGRVGAENRPKGGASVWLELGAAPGR